MKPNKGNLTAVQAVNLWEDEPTWINGFACTCFSVCVCVCVFVWTIVDHSTADGPVNNKKKKQTMQTLTTLVTKWPPFKCTTPSIKCSEKESALTAPSLLGCCIINAPLSGCASLDCLLDFLFVWVCCSARGDISATSPTRLNWPLSSLALASASDKPAPLSLQLLLLCLHCLSPSNSKFIFQFRQMTVVCTVCLWKKGSDQSWSFGETTLYHWPPPPVLLAQSAKLFYLRLFSQCSKHVEPFSSTLFLTLLLSLCICLRRFYLLISHSVGSLVFALSLLHLKV